MDFDFSDDQLALRDAVAKWVEKSYDVERRKAIVAAGGFDRAVYNALAELGLTGIYVGEDHGGQGMGPEEAMVVLEELGRGIVSEPLAQAFITSATIQAYGSDEIKSAWLPKIASGEALVVLAQQERKARYRLDVCEAKADKAGAGYALTALKNIVPAGDAADAFRCRRCWTASWRCFWSSARPKASARAATSRKTKRAPPTSSWTTRPRSSSPPMVWRL